jgi:tRNA 2-selenouridine synthase
MPTVSIEEFLALRNQGFPVVDARSEKEFDAGHILGAINLPLLNNENRAIVGTAYKVSGREIAIQKGFELAGPQFAEIFKKGRKLADKQKILVYCWRGGLRSNILSWILSFTQAEIFVLENGYKNYRKKVLTTFEFPFKFLVLGGKTGTGKTEVLHNLKAKRLQIVDIEALARHKGSSFGSLGMLQQPSQEYFENSIAETLWKHDSAKKIWLENESRLIGRLVLPFSIFKAIKENVLIELEIPTENRIARLANEYAQFDPELLEDAINRLQKRLGGLRTQKALDALAEKNNERWIQTVLEYYDSTYSFGLSSRIGKNVKLNWDWDNQTESLKQLIAYDQINTI